MHCSAQVEDAITGQDLSISTQTVHVKMDAQAGLRGAGMDGVCCARALARRLADVGGVNRGWGTFHAQAVLVRAVAGSGKTWLILQVEQLLAALVLQRDPASGDVPFTCQCTAATAREHTTDGASGARASVGADGASTGGGGGGGGDGGANPDDEPPSTGAAKATETIMRRFPKLWKKMCGGSAAGATDETDSTATTDDTAAGQQSGGGQSGNVVPSGGRALGHNPSLIPVVVLVQRMAPLLRRQLQLVAPIAGDLTVIKQYLRTYEAVYAPMLEMALELRMLVLLVDGIDEGATVKEEVERYVVRVFCASERVCACVCSSTRVRVGEGACVRMNGSFACGVARRTRSSC
jgi:hypothetical protein